MSYHCEWIEFNGELGPLTGVYILFLTMNYLNKEDNNLSV